MAMTPKEVLIGAKALINTKEKWFGGDSPRRHDSTQRCLALAVHDAAARDSTATEAALDALRAVLPTRSDLFTYNDTHTYRACVRVLNRAIASCS